MAEVRSDPILFETTLLEIINILNFQMSNNKAGSLNTYLQKWQEFTSDPEILDTVSVMTIEFDGVHKIPQPRANHCSKWEKMCIEVDLDAHMKKGLLTTLFKNKENLFLLFFCAQNRMALLDLF